MQFRDGINLSLKELAIRISPITPMHAYNIFILARLRSYFFLITGIAILSISGCSSSEKKSREEYEPDTKEIEEVSGSNAVFEIAKLEQENSMYSVESDTTILYWLDNMPAELSGFTKCNVFALNVLKRAGYKTPDENCLTSDMFDTSLYTDVFPVAGVNQIDVAEPGDLIVWNGHVIIFEKIVSAGGDEYALGWWAGTRQEDNGNNIQNNVCYGKYPLDGDFIIRRPVRKKN